MANRSPAGLWLIIVTLSYPIGGAVQAQTAAEWAAADSAVARFSPEAFPQVPVAVQAEVDAMGCRIPQASWVADPRPHNVISGSFAAKGQTDWAVLCSRELASVIIVVWGGPVRCASTIGDPRPDRAYLQGAGGRIHYSRQIGSNTLDEWSGRVPDEVRREPEEHELLLNLFLEKAAVAYYCQGGEWLSFEDEHQ